MGSADSAPHLSPTITIALPWTAPSFAAVKGIIHAPGAFAPHLPVAPYHSGDRRWRSAAPADLTVTSLAKALPYSQTQQERAISRNA